MSSTFDRLLASKGKSIEPSSKMKMLNVQVTPQLHAAFKNACKAVGRDMSVCQRTLIEDFVRDAMMASKGIRDFRFETEEERGSEAKSK